MVWPFKPKTRKQIARIEITGAIASDTRKRVLKALENIPPYFSALTPPGEPWGIPKKFMKH